MAELDNIIAPSVALLGYEYLGAELVNEDNQRVLRVFIDSDAGINISDCEKVSKQVSAVLDVEDPIAGQYTLLVSSPGLDRPLFTPEHYQRFNGHPIKIKLSVPMDGRRNFKGLIKAVSEEKVTLELEDGQVDLPFAGIEKANLIPEF